MKMKKTATLTVLVLSLVLFFICVPAGCGGKKSEKESLSEPERLLDNALREASKGNNQPLLELWPPEVREMMAEGIPALSQQIIEVHYRTEEIDPDHVKVYYWGTFQLTVDGETKTNTIGEAEAQGIPMVRKDGKWFFDVGSQLP